MGLVLSLRRHQSDSLVASAGSPFGFSVDLQILTQASQILNQGVATRQPMETLRSQIAPLMDQLDGLRETVPAHHTNLRRLVDDPDSVNRHAIQLTAEALSLLLAGHAAVQAAEASPTRPSQMAPRPSVAPPLWRGPTPSRRVLPAGMESHLLCPDCSAVNQRGFRFCHQCRAPLDRSSLPRPERRLMTIIFTDFKGFTAACDRYKGQDEIMDEILGRYEEEFRREVTQNGGEILKPLGDGLLIVFGFQKTSEDDAVRAVRVAFNLQILLKKANEEFASRGLPTFLMRIGINTGEVLKRVSRATYEEDVLGAIVNEAARTEGNAEVGSVLITQSTYRELEKWGHPFVLKTSEDPEKQFLKGKRAGEISESIRVYTVVRERIGRVLRLRGGTDQISFLGRKKEIDNLLLYFSTAKMAFENQMVAVVGEAGLGKSRLAAEFLERLKEREEKFTLIEARGDDIPTLPPYVTLANALRVFAAVMPADLPEEQRRKIRTLIEGNTLSTPEEQEMLVHLIGNLVDIPFENPSEEMAFLLKNPAKLRERTHEALVSLFDQMSRRQPVVLLLEDLHWMDRSSQQMIALLLEKLQRRRFFVLGLTRPEFLDQDSELLRGPYAVRRIELSGLPETTLLKMAQEILGDRLTDDLREFLITQSDGNPYLLQEMARALHEGWKVSRDPHQGWLFRSPEGKTVPVGVQGFLEARIDLLPREQSELLRAAAVIGQEFSLDDISHLLNAEPAAAGTVLAELVDRKFLHALGPTQFQFSHALLRDNAYHKLLQTDRQGHHERFAEHLCERKGPFASLIAFHFEKASRAPDAAHYYVVAAEEAAQEGEWTSSTVYFQKAYELADSPQEKYRISRGWDAVLVRSANWSAEDDVLQRAETLLSHLSDVDRAGWHYRRGRSLNRRQRLDEAEGDLQEALRLSGQDEVTKLIRVGTLIELGFLEVQRGHYDKGREFYRQAEDLAREIGSRRDLGRTLMGIAQVETKRGHHFEVFRANDEAFRIFREIEDNHLMVIALAGRGNSLSLLGAYREAEENLREAIELSRKFGSRGQGMESLYNSLGRALDLMGQTPAAIETLQGSLETNPNHLYIVFTYAYLAQATLRNGDLDRARGQASRALEVARERKSQEGEAMALTILAQILLAGGETEQALGPSQLAVQRFKELGGVEAFDSEILLTHARILAALGRTDEARNHIPKSLLEERASNISDERFRRTFLENIEVNRRIIQLARELGI